MGIVPVCLTDRGILTSVVHNIILLVICQLTLYLTSRRDQRARTSCVLNQTYSTRLVEPSQDVDRSAVIDLSHLALHNGPNMDGQ